MPMYGEIKRNLDDFTVDSLLYLKEECLRNIEEGILPDAEMDLLQHVNAEIERRNV